MPRRKPATARQNRETRDIGLVRRQEGRVPECPKLGGKAMLAETVRAWARFWESDVSGLVVDADMAALERMFGMYDMRARMMKEYLKSPFSAGSMGQLKAHPAAAEIASLDSRIVALEDRFGITPSGRLKLGIVLGAAAKSLEDINAGFLEDTDDQEQDHDPRLKIIDTTGTG